MEDKEATASSASYDAEFEHFINLKENKPPPADKAPPAASAQQSTPSTLPVSLSPEQNLLSYLHCDSPLPLNEEEFKKKILKQDKLLEKVKTNLARLQQ